MITIAGQNEIPKLRCGYAGTSLFTNNNFKTFHIRDILNEDFTKITMVINFNIVLLREIIELNLINGIKVFRMPTGIIPYLSHPKMNSLLYKYDILWSDFFVKVCNGIFELVKKNNIEISIHPGQYNVLNSPDRFIVERTVLELELQAQLLAMVGGRVLVLHVGGYYNNKKGSLKRFLDNARNYLTPKVISCLAVENDDKVYNADDVSYLAQEMNCNWVLDFHHEKLNPSIDLFDNIMTLNPIKYHICEGVEGKAVSSHGAWVGVDTINHAIQYLKYCNIKEAVLMFEAGRKDKSIFDSMYSVGDGYWQPNMINKRLL